MAHAKIYSGFELCTTLQTKQKCVRLRKYNAGQGEPFTDLFHEHFPAHRISDGDGVEMLKALVVRYQCADAAQIVRCYLNDRGGQPEHSEGLRITVEHPEPGVLRKYCGGDVQGWIDTVISPAVFRQPS